MRHSQTIFHTNEYQADFADDIAHVANTIIQTESLLPRLEQATDSNGYHVSPYKMENMSFNQKGNIFKINGGSLKLADKLNCSASSASSIENYIKKKQQLNEGMYCYR